ncbi:MULTISPECIES: septation ring formation regulator EzrA [Bacillus]|uniref:septation ring formation regulator EzrA n=1 Tax=Bacillus TaxID=1386 RepID=UPI000BB834C8|nr:MULTISPECIES: septation ring formation regulator EzrA [Bacillus]
MKIVIGILVLAITFVTFSYFTRKKIYSEVDRLEVWKMSIMNKPVTEELSKVKDLNMTGQTEELFENWRNKWDDILTYQLPNIEEMLFDAEEYADKYRFKKAKAVAKKADEQLTEIEKSIDEIYAELQELIGSQADSNEKATTLEEKYKQCKKHLLTQRHQYGNATTKLEKNLEAYAESFTEFKEAIDNGNYLVARDLINKVENEIAEFEYKLNELPNQLIECHSIIPGQLAEIESGYKDMIEEGYKLDHLKIEEKVETLRSKLKVLLELLNNTDVKQASEGVSSVKEELESLYDLIEKEALSKQYINKEIPTIHTNLGQLTEQSTNSKEETIIVQESYQLLEDDLTTQKTMESNIQKLNNRFLILKQHLEEKSIAYSILKEELEDICEQINSIQEVHEQYVIMLQALRKDEMAAREQLVHLRKLLFESRRMIDKNNLPGLPKDFYDLIAETNSNIKAVTEKLEEKPLNIIEVNVILQHAVASVEKCYNETKDIIENAALAEKVIQYGNRYRSKYNSVHERLVEAEQLFRSFQYAAALEEAATSLEEVDPGVLKRIDKLIEKRIGNDEGEVEQQNIN